MGARTAWMGGAVLAAALWTQALGQEAAFGWPQPPGASAADEEVIERVLPPAQDEDQRGRRARIAALRDSLDYLLRGNRGDALLCNLDEAAELQ